MSPLRDLFGGKQGAGSKAPAPDISQLAYMQLKLYNSMEEAAAAYDQVVEKRAGLTIPSQVELRKAKSKDVYPVWLVFYVEAPRYWDRLLSELGGGDFQMGRAIFAKCSDYDDGSGAKKYASIIKESSLVKSVRLR